MNSQLPAYYTKLAPFQALFEQGNPILTYHKLGISPKRVRLKGMYVSKQLFTRQLKELKTAGFTSSSLNDWDTPASKKIVITFDDGYVNVLRKGLEPLREVRFTSIQFLPVNLLGKCNEWDVPLGEAPEPIMDASQVREWMAAGHEIGSHSLSHPFLTRLAPALAREEISSSRKKLEDLFGRQIQHFCYPYGDWNESVSALVQEAGYKTACTTDTGLNQPGQSPFALKRFTARYASRNMKAVWAWLKRQVS
jgi:peptidoglycan/xylan/chitin deacetylase (PgdA/CDA1 family)